MVVLNQQNSVGKGFIKRWHHHLNPEITKDKWTTEDNERLFDLHKIHGSKWKVIASLFDKRTDNGIKNQFFSIIRKSLRKACKFSEFPIAPAIINTIKPKILSHFLETPIEFESDIDAEMNITGPMKMSDIIKKFAFSKSNDSGFKLQDKWKWIINRHLSLLEKSKLYKKQAICCG